MAMFQPQLPQVAALAAEHPDNIFVLNHAGMAISLNPEPHARAEIFSVWRENLIALARRPNVYCKIGGLGMFYWSFGFMRGPVCIGHKHRGGTAMVYFAGLDVSLEETAICIVDDVGKIVREARVASEPEALIAFFGSCGMKMERVGLEACPLTAWLHQG